MRVSCHTHCKFLQICVDALTSDFRGVAEGLTK